MSARPGPAANDAKNTVPTREAGWQLFFERGTSIRLHVRCQLHDVDTTTVSAPPGLAILRAPFVKAASAGGLIMPAGTFTAPGLGVTSVVPRWPPPVTPTVRCGTKCGADDAGALVTGLRHG